MKNGARLTHLDDLGQARMVDVGSKPATRREAIAEGELSLGPEALAALREGTLAKGDAFAAARLAGILAAKRTDEWIPLAHPIALESVEVSFEEAPGGVRARAAARTEGKTGVEMEALVAVSAALLTLYDMLKSLDRGMVLGPVYLVEKSGGRSGPWRRVGRPRLAAEEARPRLAVEGSRR